MRLPADPSTPQPLPRMVAQVGHHRPPGRGFRLAALADGLRITLLGVSAFVAALAILAHRTDRLRVQPGDGSAGDVHLSMTEPGPAVTPASEGVAAELASERRIGILAGHWQYDTGAVCEDGLREVDVTTDVALRAEVLLEAHGYDVEILPEHDPDVPAEPILGFRGAAVVAIHADSCEVPGASGFKVARWADSSTPDDDDALVGCLETEYAKASLLPRHDDSITTNMTHYYALREIAPETPGAIIEVGFLLGDREFLDDHRYEVALGIVNGVLCFRRGRDR